MNLPKLSSLLLVGVVTKIRRGKAAFQDKECCWNIFEGYNLKLKFILRIIK